MATGKADPCGGSFLPELLDKDGELIAWYTRDAVWLLYRGLYDVMRRICDLKLVADPVVIDAPGALTFTAARLRYGFLSIPTHAIAGNNVAGSTELHFVTIGVDETTMDLYVVMPAIDTTDPFVATVTLSPQLALTATTAADYFAVGDYVLIEDPTDSGVVIDVLVPGVNFQRHECAVVTAVALNVITLKRVAASALAGKATFGSLLGAHTAGRRMYKLELKAHSRHQKQLGTFIDKTEDLPDLIDLYFPSHAVCAVTGAASNDGGFGPWTTLWLPPAFSIAAADVPLAPGVRTMIGQSHQMGVGGLLADAQIAPFPEPIQDTSSVRMIYAAVRVVPSGGDCVVEVFINYGSGPLLLATLTISSGQFFSYPLANPPVKRNMPFGIEWRDLQILKQDATLTYTVTTANSAEGLILSVQS